MRWNHDDVVTKSSRLPTWRDWLKMSPLSLRSASRTGSFHSECHSLHLSSLACAFCAAGVMTSVQYLSTRDPYPPKHMKKYKCTVLSEHAMFVVFNRRIYTKRLPNFCGSWPLLNSIWIYWMCILTYLISIFLRATKSQWSTFSTEKSRNRMLNFVLGWWFKTRGRQGGREGGQQGVREGGWRGREGGREGGRQAGKSSVFFFLLNLFTLNNFSSGPTFLHEFLAQGSCNHLSTKTNQYFFYCSATVVLPSATPQG